MVLTCALRHAIVASKFPSLSLRSLDQSISSRHVVATTPRGQDPERTPEEIEYFKATRQPARVQSAVEGERAKHRYKGVRLQPPYSYSKTSETTPRHRESSLPMSGRARCRVTVQTDRTEPPGQDSRVVGSGGDAPPPGHAFCRLCRTDDQRLGDIGFGPPAGF